MDIPEQYPPGAKVLARDPDSDRWLPAVVTEEGADRWTVRIWADRVPYEIDCGVTELRPAKRHRGLSRPR